MSIKGRLPEGIQEPDELDDIAAYNVGLGHLLDARRIVRMKVVSPRPPGGWCARHCSRWQKRQWYQQVRYGYARGGEPVIYVRNIRRYYEILNYVYRSQQQFYQLNERQITDDEGDNNPFDNVPSIL